MKKVLVIISVLISFVNAGFSQIDDEQDKPAWYLNIDSATVTAQRIIKDIGVQQTKLDTIALRENISTSMADVLTQNTVIFIKSYGRATLSTASFRGTAPSHTQVTWNGMKLNSPMLGMVDFSLIPSYFIDDASLYHGASSVSITGGGLGGAIAMNTKPSLNEGLAAQYIQGFSSFDTYDSFLRLNYKNKNFQSSTRVVYTDSDNDFKYKNYDKKEFIKDENDNITGFEYPIERNRNGDYKDFHALQEFYFTSNDGSHFGLSTWYMKSKRGVPVLNLDYRSENSSRSQQDEQTLRTVLLWDKSFKSIKLMTKAGYTYTDLSYTYSGDDGTGKLVKMIHSQSYVNTVFAKFDIEYYLGKKWMFSASAGAHQNSVNSKDDAILNLDNQSVIIGYIKSRFELSTFVSAKYRPTERLGFAINIREEFYGNKNTPIIPAAFINYDITQNGSIKAKASIARNYRYPTLNDLYFMPGGNDSLDNEKGYTYDGGIEFSLSNKKTNLKGEITAFNSNIKNWIVWLPNFKGFWSPSNVKKVNSYGIEIKLKNNIDFDKGWKLSSDGNFAWTRSINHDNPVNWADESIGKQLVYIPEFSAAITAKLSWKTWMFTYKWNYYSERFTTSNNEKNTKTGRLGAYFMNDISIEKNIRFSWASVSFKLLVNNIFDEEHQSVLSRPMPGRNFGFFIEIKPDFKNKKDMRI
ncbi:MAG: TonB-dependent receptor plug domain-containing protein [Prevotellaceae bacterium]|jgi:iron complex outermembrane receptor protein|nr:TonB-dependent receptor plug domain-containing protein [Prevotellaceae bacterium]